MNKGLLIVLSGPSGAGKGTVYSVVTKALGDIGKSISVTTRAPRAGEVDGVHYHFRTVAQYNEMKEKGEFLETAQVYNNYYGTPLAPVMQMLSEGKDVLFEIDIEGAKQIKEKYPECVSVFIMPPSFEILEERLRGRGTEDENSLATRLGSARGELAQFKRFDYIVFNDEVSVAAQKVIDIIAAEKCRISRNEEKILGLLKNKNL